MCRAPALILALLLSSCGSDGARDASAISDRSVADCKVKVSKTASSSVVNSLAREWGGVPEDTVRCLLDDVGVMSLQRVNEDPAVKAAFDKCGVDPAVVHQ